MLLVDCRLTQSDLFAAELKRNFAGAGQAQLVCAGESEPDAIRIGMRSHDKVKLELLLVSVVDGIDSGIDAGIPDSAEGRVSDERPCHSTVDVIHLAR